MSAMDLIDDFIAELEARLNLQPGEAPSNVKGPAATAPKDDKNKKPKQQKTQPQPPPAAEQPEICKLEFKVGQITKVWVHPKADKLYCEEIDVGEDETRQIASGLRPHFTEEQMLGQRLLVASNLKAKNLVGFKSHGMVLCAARPIPGGEDKEGAEKEVVEFIEPPVDAKIGEIITFEGLPPPQPVSGAQVEKKKVWKVAAEGMKTTDDCRAAWNGHVFMTSAGPCTTKTIAGGVMR